MSAASQLGAGMTAGRFRQTPLYDRIPVAETAFLHPGQVIALQGRFSVTTILGSCVAVCLFDARRRIGGMNHFLLPHQALGSHASPRFANEAMRRLVSDMCAFGARVPDLEAKVFGGACVLDAFRGTAHIGAQNARAAMTLLEGERIPVVASDLGGDRGRRLVFHTDDGSAFIRTI